MQPDSREPLDATVLTWNPPPAVDDENRAVWAGIVRVMPTDRLVAANVPAIVAATRLQVKLNAGDADIETIAALRDLLHFLGLTPDAAGVVRGGRQYDLPTGSEAS